MPNLTSRERFIRCCLGQDVDRAPFLLYWGPWGSTWERWKREGMTHASYEALRHALGADPSPHQLPINFGACPVFGKILEEDEHSITFIDRWGITRRDLKTTDSMSEFIDFPVKNWDDWRRYKKERLDPEHPDRFADGWLDLAREWMKRDLPIQLGGFPDVTLFGAVRWMMGDEECLIAYHEQPDLVHDIMETFNRLALSIYQKVIDAGVRVDLLHIWEDMAGRAGPLLSPTHVREFMTPRYRRWRDFADRNNIPLMSVDSDGYPDLILPAIIDGGVNLFFPLEVAAGCDVNVFQQKYPTLAFMGGIDKRVLAATPDEIDAEIARIQPAIRRGRYIPELDHLIPNDVSWSNFQHYARRLREALA
jgi:uroporphyrinogen-III decarboxylase